MIRTRTDEVERWLAEPGHVMVRPGEDHYPPLLGEIPDAPDELYVSGDCDALLRPQIAVVGSRKCTAAGAEFARWISLELARAGYAICSGLAQGIDAAAHQGALQAGGRTVAVLGSGVDRVYPARHRKLAGQITEAGALISEYPLSAPPRAGHFPRRNRIISGMSLGLLVVEAAPRSGSLITARLAMEQGREVFAVPGSVRSPMSRGCHSLIREGVTLVEEPEHILSQLESLLNSHLQQLGRLRRGDGRLARAPGKRRRCPDQAAPGPAAKPAASSGRRAARPRKMAVGTAPVERLLQSLGFDTVHVDTLVERTGLAIHELNPLLLQLEIEGRVQSVAGGYTLVPGGALQDEKD